RLRGEASGDRTLAVDRVRPVRKPTARRGCRLMTTQSDLKENYRRAYGNRIGFGKHPALILIDFVEAYFDPECELYADVDDALSSALRIRDAARLNGIPVIYTNVVYQAGGVDGGRF